MIWVLSCHSVMWKERSGPLLTLPVSIRNREEVFTNRERGFVPGLGCEEVSNLPGGSSFYPGYRSSTPKIHHGSGEGCTSDLGSKDTALVPVSGCLFLPDWVPRHQVACQLWRFISLTPTTSTGWKTWGSRNVPHFCCRGPSCYRPGTENADS